LALITPVLIELAVALTQTVTSANQHYTGTSRSSSTQIYRSE